MEVLLPSSAQAIIILGPTPHSIVDRYDWGNFAFNGTPINNPFQILNNGNFATISQTQPNQNFTIVQQSPVPVPLANTTAYLAPPRPLWEGNFSPWTNPLYSAHLLYNNGGGAITIDFNQPIFGASTQIQSHLYGNFTANVQAFDLAGNLLGNSDVAGLSNGNADGSAVWISVHNNANNAPNISRLVYSTNDNDFAIAAATPVPLEINALPVAASTILFGLGMWLKRKYQENKYSQDFNKEQVN
ncbi:hypothetical protein H6G25_20035 [Dolichospermum sp. FACHB-1091]|uniref:hypothetical protein n=1 Tax=Dolichospermum sp. FACHB-1091 TaxID=2692798 RepID=UPI001680E9C7|nr:hypothetical protein [Dolichospermum sp. FACHB-1091]MBD2445420.1 hypothetical protein [Dolichospermum sp. FACHB-1091]